MMHEMWDLHSHLKPQIQEYVGDWFLEGLCTSVQGSARLGRVVLGVEATLILWKRGETGDFGLSLEKVAIRLPGCGWLSACSSTSSLL